MAEQQRTRRRPLLHNPEAVRWWRVKAGLSLTQAAMAARVSRGHVSNVELGYSNSSTRLLHAFAGVFGCDVTALMTPPPGNTSSPAGPGTPGGAAVDGETQQN